MSRIRGAASGHEEQFVRRRLSDRFRFNQVTFAEAVASWSDPPRAITFGLSDLKGKQRHRGLVMVMVGIKRAK